ncbi:hypothetical protein FE257_009805 [Aspergillus nanangensis]|uniref:Amino acid permease/ SLC12A domain-containing protein n=1 Tax=Aspergillus nanangensis TaxID=2582783 RepID=A0AAD4GSF3_ASPNN|nr:hypothetical protein FE257_009805 [Aspergillus nanangensis]
MTKSSSDVQRTHATIATATHDGGAHPIVDKPIKRSGASTDIAEKGAIIDHSDDSVDDGSTRPAYDETQRRLKPRHIQLIGIGGTIGTALYVQIGKTLIEGGPGSLFIAFSVW